LTEEPYEVTRTTAIIPAEILNGLSSVTKRGIVFGTMPNPVLKDGSSSSSSSDTPVMSSLSPSNGKITGTSATLSLATDVDATCKYGTTAGTAYDQIASTFSTTGAKTHSELVSNLETGKSYTYYVRCKNTSSGSVNTADGVISFTVSSGGGSTDSGPARSNLLPSGTVATTSVDLKVTTDVDATCKYGTNPATAYADMRNDFTAATGGKNHSAQVTSLIVGKQYTYYVRCQNTSSGAVNTTDEVISFTGTTAYLAPEHSQQLFAVSDKILSNALQNVGNFFVGTAIAADSTTASTTTDTTSTTAATASDFLEEGNTSEGSGNGAFSSKLKNLKPGTFFYARAYAISGGTTYYGNQVGFRTADSCFVATAAYGSIFHPSVQILRDFRDQFLRSNAVSRSLIDFYYSYSPSIADIISQHNSLRFAVRMLLLPVTGAAWLALQIGMSGLLLLMAVVALLMSWHHRYRRKTQGWAAIR
jgi:hypothetical protein